MSDYETLNVPNGNSSFFTRLQSDHINTLPDVFKHFNSLKCPKCPNGGSIMTTNDGNRNHELRSESA